MRRRNCEGSVIGLYSELQWGRNFIVAETGIVVLGVTKIILLQWGRNFIVAETDLTLNAISLASTGFNGTATLSLRRRADTPVTLVALSMLQWGRNFIVAETLALRMNLVLGLHLACFNGAATLSLRRQWFMPCLWPRCHRITASMGPQLYRCGDMAHESGTLWSKGTDVASMGPQLYRCGDVKLRITPAFQYALQWGSTFIVAETRAGTSHTWHKEAGFNGAATLSLRRPRRSNPRCAHGATGSGGGSGWIVIF